MPTSFETNPYLILFASALKPQPKPVTGLLDPPQDEAGIRARWQEVDKQKTNGLAPEDYERLYYNGKLGEVKAKLLDGGTAERKRHVEEARKEIERRCLASIREYVLGGGNDISAESIGKVVLSIKRWLNADTVVKFAESFGYRIVDNAATKENPLPTPAKPMDWPDQLTRKAGVIEPHLQECLGFLGAHENRTIQTVYDFLKVPCTCSLETLQKRLSEMEETSEYKVAGRKHYNANTSKQTPHLSAAEKIFKVLYVVLKSDESRKKWDRCCALTQIDALLRQVFTAQITQGPKVSTENYLGAVKKCREKGLSKADAEYYVYEFFVIEKKCPMPQYQPQKEAQEEPRFCGSCHAANPHGAKNCRQCRAPLDVSCPKCGKKAEYGDGNCPNCGFAVGDMPLALPLLEEAKDDLAKNDIAGALAKVERALEYWPKLDDAEKLKLEIEKRKRDIDKIIQSDVAQKEAAKAESERQSAISKFNDAVREGRFDDAERLFPELASKRVVGKELDALKGVLAMARFDAALAEFRFDNAVRFIGDVVRYGVDTEANLKARVATAKNGKLQFVRTSFSEALSKGEIVKAESLLLSFKNSGCPEREAAQMQKSIDERKGEIAEARANELVGKLKKVEALKATGSTQGKPTVSLSWKPGIGGTAVVKWRLTRHGRTQPFPDIDGTATCFEDRGGDLKLGVEYIYEITPLAEIKNASGKPELRPNDEAKVQSSHAVCLAPVGKVTGSGEGFPGGDASVELSWSMPSQLSTESVKIEIIRTPQFSPTQKAVTLSGSLLSWSDKDVRIDEEYDYSIALVAGVFRTVPAKSGRICVKRASPPPPPENVKVRRSGDGEFIIEWDWNGTETGAIVSVRSRSATTARDRPIERLAGESRGRITHYLQGNGFAEVTLKAYRMIGGKRLLGEGSRPVSFGEAVEIDCSLECQRGWFRKPALLRVESASGALPPLSVRIGDPEPVFPDDGEDLGSPVPVSGNPGEAALPIDASKRGYVHVFLCPPASSADWIVLQPENNHLK